MTEAFTYTCAICGDVCISDVPDEEATKELKENFGDVDPSECDVVCDDCYKLIVDLPAGVYAPMKDLFGPVPRKPPTIRMRAIDHGQAPGLMPGWKTAQGAHFRCWRCGHDDGWSFDMNVIEIKRGLPCPACNAQQEERRDDRTLERLGNRRTYGPPYPTWSYPRGRVLWQQNAAGRHPGFRR